MSASSRAGPSGGGRPMTRRYGLRDDQWERIPDLLPGREGHVGVTAKDKPLVRGGGALPLSRRHPVARPAGAVRRLEDGAHPVQPRRWARSGVWERIFQHLAGDAANEYAMIDSTIVRAHQHSAGAQGGTGPKRRSAAARGA